MTILIVDGIKIDTTIKIDALVASFKDQGEAIGARRRRLSNEIANYKADLQNFGTTRPRDPYGEAHTKASINEMERLQEELAEEWQKKVEGLNPRKD
jgi:hypothetical protein